MNNMKKKSPILKTLVGISLSLSVAFSANLLVTPQSAHAATATETVSSKAAQVFSIGQKFIGVPYKFGASAKTTSVFDCSSFTQYVYKQVGVDLPRSSRQQATAGTYVSRSNLQPGDLIFSDTNKDGVINHVSIYMGNGKLLHTYRVGIGVTISTFAGSAWDKTYVTARRVLPSGGQAVTTPSTDPVVTPEPTKPEPTKPEPTKPEPTKPEPTKPEPTKPTTKPSHHHWNYEY